MADFLRNMTVAHAAFLDSLPKAEREALDREIIAAQKHRQGMLSVHQLGEALNIGRDAVNNLPLPFVRPYQNTSRGMRQVKSVHRDDLIAFLISLNEDFCDFDPVTETLSKDPQAGSKFVQLSARIRRYRRCESLSLADMIMGDVP
jgi:hypothetical protein